MKIKVEPFLIKRGNRLAKAAIEFESNDSFLNGFHLVGFTVCEDVDKGLFVLFPASSRTVTKETVTTDKSKPFFFLRPSSEEQIAKLESAILDCYENMMDKAK